MIEYPADQIRAKVDHMTKLLEDAFQTKMLSHRAGRWAFNEYYASLLLEYGYQVDCSVTPRVNWQFSPGNPQGNGGTDYSRFPSQAYFIDPQNIAKPGASALLEVPMSIQYKHSALMNAFNRAMIGCAASAVRRPSTGCGQWRQRGQDDQRGRDVAGAGA